MKKAIGFVLVAVLIGFVVPAEAQLRFGVRGGVNISSVHFSSDDLKSDNITGFHIGPMIETTLPLVGLGLDAAILYTQKGMDFKQKGAEVESESIRTDYIDVPVNLKWKLGLPLVKPFIAAGPYVGFRVGGDKVWDIPGNMIDQVKAKSFSAGLNLGVGAEVFNHLQVGLNYNLGLTNNYSAQKPGLANKNGKNRGWAVTAAILF